MIFSFSFAFISFAGMAILVGRHVKEARAAGIDNELPLRHFYDLYKDKVIRFWRDIFLPHFFQSAEGIVSKTRRLVQEMEKSLSKLDSHISGKYKKMENINRNGNGSKYWNDVIEFKNSLPADERELNNGSEDKKEN